MSEPRAKPGPGRDRNRNPKRDREKGERQSLCGRVLLLRRLCRPTAPASGPGNRTGTGPGPGLESQQGLSGFDSVSAPGERMSPGCSCSSSSTWDADGTLDSLICVCVCARRVCGCVFLWHLWIIPIKTTLPHGDTERTNKG
ncbi:uncharacterized protein LOC117585178 [Drosophila guanche]|uniref:uncharacterized protein LOC117585178 n=1 Tax=Drosophila guanche TaxID=7266 RepID=UPI001470D329|nr:uncharacterized protein LOC117585178 [Drosophila guanche]